MELTQAQKTARNLVRAQAIVGITLGSFVLLMMIALAVVPILLGGDQPLPSVSDSAALMYAFYIVIWGFPMLYFVVSGILLLRFPSVMQVKVFTIISIALSVSGNIPMLVLSIITLVQLKDYVPRALEGQAAPVQAPPVIVPPQQ